MSEDNSFAQNALKAVEAAISGRATDAILEQEVDGVKLKYMSLEQLWKTHGRLKLMADAEEGKGIVFPGSVELEFH